MTFASLNSVALPRLRALLMMSALATPGAAWAATPNGVAAPMLLGRTEAGKTISVALGLPSRDPSGAAAFVSHVTRPGDPLYRHYLTPEAYAARFGAREEDYAALVAWANARGLSVGERYTARTVLAVSGSTAAMEQALGTTFSNYRDASGRVFYAAEEGHLPAGIAGKVTAVIGLSDAAHFKAYVRRLPAGQRPIASGSGPNGGFLAADLRRIYAVPAQPFPARTETLAVFEQGGFDPNDIAIYLKANKLAAVPVRVRNVNQYGGGIDDPNVELESVLDIDMQIGINPAARQVLVYEDGQDSFPVALLDSLSAMASDNIARSISISYGQDETLQGSAAIAAENQVLMQMAAQGQAVFASAGDSGAYGDQSLPLNVSDPASQPFVTGVGGTTLFDSKGAYLIEKVWDDLSAFSLVTSGATGGGISIAWPIPSYQMQAAAASGVSSTTQRNVPDVAAVGDPLTGVDVYSALNGGWVTVGGTSVSAPIWAGFYSLVNAASEGLGFGAAGFANPAIYQLGTNFNGVVSPDFRDVTIGRNGDQPVYGVDGFYAALGYDNTTGFGSFQGSNALIDLSITPSLAQTGSPPPVVDVVVTPSPTAATITWKGSPGDRGYIVYLANYATNAEVSATLQKGFKATVSHLAPNTTYELFLVAVSATGTTVAVPNIFATPAKAS